MKKILLTLALIALGATPKMTWALDKAEATVGGKYQVSANWSELKRGWNVLTIKVEDADRNTVSGATVTVPYDMATMPMNPPQKPVLDKGEGIYEKSGDPEL